jgi:class 3 adenylate cyclase
LIIFRNVKKAVLCAIKMQEALQVYNQSRPAEEQVLLCVGIGYGKMLRVGEADVFGQEVNAASKLGEDIAAAGEILATQAVVDQTKDLNLIWNKLEQPLKGMGEAFRLKY